MRRRALSPLQQAIMEAARKGYVTPWEASECACGPNTTVACAYASGSRALRRLVKRGLLVFVPHRDKGQSDLYKLAGWDKPLPWVDSAPTKEMKIEHYPGLHSFKEATKDFCKRLNVNVK